MLFSYLDRGIFSIKIRLSMDYFKSSFYLSRVMTVFFLPVIVTCKTYVVWQMSIKNILTF